MLHRLAAALFLLLAGCVHRPYAFSKEAIRGALELPKPLTHQGRVGSIGSGMQFVTYQFDGEADVELVMSFRGGTSDEPPGKEGVAILAAYLADQAMPGRGGLRLEERHYAAGILGTWRWDRDELSLSMLVKTESLREALRVEGWRLREPAAGITEAQVARTREYLADRLERLGTGFDDQARRAEGLAMAGTPYGRLEPTPEGLRKLTLQDVTAYLEAVVRPERAILTLSSGQPPEATMRVAREILADLARPTGGGTPATTEEPDPMAFTRPQPLVASGFTPKALASGLEPVTLKSDRRRLWLAWAVPGSNRYDGPLLSYASDVLRIAAGHRLKDEGLLEQVGEITGRGWSRNSAGVILVAVVLKPGADPVRIRAVVERSTALAQERIKHALASRHQAGTIRQQAQLSRYVRNEGRTPILEVAASMRATGEPDPSARFQRAVESLASGEATGQLVAWLGRGPSAVMLVEPSKEALAERSEPVTEDRSAPTWEEFGSLDPGAAPGAQAVRALLDPPGLDRAQRRRLANGLEVAVVVRRGPPFVQSMLVFRGANGFSELLRARNYLATARRSLPVGCGDVLTGVGIDGAVLGTASTLDGLRLGLEEMACWLEVSEAEARERTMTALGKTRIELTDRAFLARPAPPVDDQPRWGDRWARRTMRPERATLVVAGDVEPEATFALAEKVLGGWAAAPGAPALPPAVLPAPEARTIIVYDEPKSTAVWARVYLRASGDQPGTEAEQAVLAALLQARLERVLLRGEFRVTLDEVTTPDGNILDTLFEGKADRLAAALKKVLAELATLGSAIDDPVALTAARWNAARRLAFAFNRTSDVALGAGALARSNLPPDGYEHLGEQLAGVTPARLRALLARYSVGREGIRIGGPFEQLAPALRALELDPIRVPDEKDKPKE